MFIDRHRHVSIGEVPIQECKNDIHNHHLASTVHEMKIKTNGMVRCPTCNNGTVRAYTEDGGMGDWCTYCKRSVQLTLKIAQQAAIICPHCQSRGTVSTREVKEKKGISGGKATAALLTGGVSLCAVGLSRKEKVTEARCSSCGLTWHFH